MAPFAAFDLCTECAQVHITRSGGAVPHKRCPVAAVVTYGCLIDRFARGRISACIHCSRAILCSPLLGVRKALRTMGLIDGEILILAFGVVAKLVIVAAVGATAAKRPRDRPILSKDAITRISRLSAAVMCSASAHCHTSRHRADVDDVGLTRSIQSRTGSRAS